MVDDSSAFGAPIAKSLQMHEQQDFDLRRQLEESQTQLSRAQDQAAELNAKLQKWQDEAVEQRRTAEKASVSSGVGVQLKCPYLHFNHLLSDEDNIIFTYLHVISSKQS